MGVTVQTAPIKYKDPVTGNYIDIIGFQGPTPSISVGSVTEGAEAAASITGTSVAPVLNLVLPQADTSYLYRMIGPIEESSTAATAHAVGEIFLYDNKLYRATTAIEVGDSIVVSGENKNCEEKTLSDNVLIHAPVFSEPEVLVDTTTLEFTFDEDNNWYSSVDNPFANFGVNDFNSLNYKFIIEWDGTEYEEYYSYFGKYQSDISDNTVYFTNALGNTQIIGSNPPYTSIAPFVICYNYFKDQKLKIITLNNSQTHIIKIIRQSFIADKPLSYYYTNPNYIQLGTQYGIMLGGVTENASGAYSLAEGFGTLASGAVSHAEGAGTKASGNYTHAEGFTTTALSVYAHAEGLSSTASGAAAHAEGHDTQSNGQGSHSEGVFTTAFSIATHAEGYQTSANAQYAHAEGRNTTADGLYSHAEGRNTLAQGYGAHAEGAYTSANGNVSHTEGMRTIANSTGQHVQGKNNIADSYASWPEWVSGTSYIVGDKVKVTTTVDNETTVTGYICATDNSDINFTTNNWTVDTYMNYADIVGNGTSDSARSNAYALDWDGNAYFAGEVYVGCNADSSGGTQLPKDVKVNGTSVVSNGVANVPIASNNTLGVIKLSSATTGLHINQDGTLATTGAEQVHVKSGGNANLVITPSIQHASTFYGLAKASGDTTQSVSSNAVGTYTDNAKASIKSMLGIVDGSTGTVNISGTTPAITAVENTRYVCGEVATLSITSPASGICIIRFTSGSTPTVLTATDVVWPDWFDATTLEASRVYEICITDGYGAVMSWAL